MSVARLTAVQRARGYRGVARVQGRTVFAYRSDFLVNALGLLVQVFLLRVVWTAVYPASHQVAAAGGGPDVTLATQIAYTTLATVQFWLFSPWQISLVPQRVREGTVAIDLARPLGFNGQMLAGQVGLTLGLAPFAVLALPFAVLIGGARAPASGWAAAGYALSLLGAYGIALLLGALMGMVAFWTLEIQGILMMYRMVSQFMSGALVPLWFMPDWLRAVAGWLPFQGTTYTPIAVYLGQLGGAGAVWRAIGVQFAWVALLWLALRLVWARALRRTVVQGG